MKPKTKQEEFMVRWAKAHRGITIQQQRYAQKHCFDDVVLRANKTCYCTACKHTWRAEVTKETRCPHCGKTLTVREHSRSIKMSAYYSVYTTTNNLQVCKWYVVNRNIGRGYDNYEYWHVGTEFIDENGKLFSVELARNYMVGCVDRWSWGSELQLRGHSFFGKWISAVASYHQSILPKLRRNGYDPQKADGVFVMTALLSSPMFESIYKVGHIAVVKHMLHIMNVDYWNCHKYKPYLMEREKVVIKLANRKHIVFDDDDKWTDMTDYVNDLCYMGKDFHNPSVLFPKDFQKAHQALAKQANARREREREREFAERERQRILNEAAKEEAKIQWLSKYCKQFTGAIWYDGDFVVKPLITMDEFACEAKHMHHCIVSYYGKPNTLLLSIEHCGKKCETAEISLDGLGKIIQCRGVNNLPSEYHKQIVDLLESLMTKFLVQLDAEIEQITLPVLASQYKYKIAI